MPDDRSLITVVTGAGIGIPRGLLGAAVEDLAAALMDDVATGEQIASLTTAAAAAHWEQMRAPVEAALRRAAAMAPVEDDAAYAEALLHTDDPDPDNPLARLLAAQAAAALAAARSRAQERLAALDAALGVAGSRGREAASEAVGAMAVDLLDLDPEDYEPEITAFVGAGQTDIAQADLARQTSDPDVRALAREALGALDADPPAAAEAVAALAAGAPPDDPAEDAVWVATIMALAEEAIALALAADPATDRPSA